MISEASRILRKDTIGSSDAAAICGMDPWRSAYDVWALKTGRIDDHPGNDAMRAGNRLESAVLDWAFDRLEPIGMQRDVSITHPHFDWCTANLDSTVIFPDGEAIVEAKTAGIYSPLRGGSWGEEGTADIPEHYTIQLQHQMMVSGHPTAYVAALIPPRGFVLFKIPRMLDVIEQLQIREEEFRSCVISDTPPEGAPSREVAKAMRRVPGSTVEIDNRIVEVWRTEKEALNNLKKRVEDHEEKIFALLGDAEAALFPGGMLTYFQTTRKGYTVKESTFRALRYKADKK